MVLYSNRDLLNKYGKETPKTWDEFVNTGKYIYNEELNQDNEICVYNGIVNGNI